MVENAASGEALGSSTDADKDFSCDYCGDPFTSQVTKRRHESKQHPSELPHECPDCGKAFHGRSGLVSHHSQIHDGRLAGYDKVCGVCGTDFTTSKEGLKYCSPECGTEAQKRRVTIECERCGDEFETTPSKADERRFCSLDCKTDWFSKTFRGENHPRWKDNTTTKECAWCDSVCETPTTKIESRDHNRVYCSRECFSRWRSKHIRGENHPLYKDSQVVCEACGDTFQKRPAKVDAHDKHFCSRGCHGEWLAENKVGEEHPRYNGGTVNYYGPNWRAQRRKVRKRDQYRCQECGATERELGQIPSAHHKVKIAHFKDKYDDPEWYQKGNRLENLILLCSSHHSKWEGVPVQPIEW